ncbi:thioredoxin [Bartonella sp. W8098]|uniref:thioredoxin n=1 Tax=Bartonella TaxID=773 RepID=UPI0018DE5DE2|nr:MULTISPECIES: thioredoxin [Bartonella]MBH9988649.1 thioredoxin [Bartonella apis]MBI0172731.1 thioredoxin [Bartonella sp. W8151]
MSDNPFAPQGGQMNANVNLANQTGGADNSVIKDTTTADFSKDVLVESKKQPVIVDFWATWCNPCKQLGPVLEKVVRQAKGAVKLVKLDIDKHPAIPGQMGIRSVPAVIAFVDGHPVDGFMGAVPESEVKKFVAKLTGNEKEAAIDEALETANELRKSGDVTGAATFYAQVLKQAPDNVTVIAAFADMLVEHNEIDQAKGILKAVPDAKKSDPTIRAVEAKIALKEETAKLGDPTALKKRIAENPKDYQAAYDLALVYNAENKRDDAADLLLGIMKADRAWNDDGARKQLLQFFEAWGAMDPATLTARRKLSSLLFS